MNAHLTADQRSQIYTLKSTGHSPAEIARFIGKDKSTVTRELKRNKGLKGYRPLQAQRLAEARKHQAKLHKRKLMPETLSLIEKKLRQEQWSPEQISGWLKKEHPELAVSHELIYQYIWSDKRTGGKLYIHLRRKAKKYNKRCNGKTSRWRIKERTDIPERPAIVETRERFGDWEADTIVGKGHKSCLVSLVDRKSRLLKLVKTYFATPYHAWERGRNENTNGLVRQYFPKGTDFREVIDREVRQVERKLNRRPRKCLGYYTPKGVLATCA